MTDITFLPDHYQPAAPTNPEITSAFLAGKTGYLVSITDEQVASIFPVRFPDPKEAALARAEAKARTAAYVAGINERLAGAHAALQPIIEHHSPDDYGSCPGCDAGDYAESAPDWPCSTIELILEGLEA